METHNVSLRGVKADPLAHVLATSSRGIMDRQSEEDFMTRAPRPPINLADSVHQQLNMYALAAGAAGVGALALAQPVEARIVYAPAHRAIKFHAIRRVHQTALIQPNLAFLKRVQRGGSFLCSEQYCTRYMVGARGKGAADTGTNHVGFRCVRE
jgi:hypothetical protein